VEYQDKKADLALIKLAGLPDGVARLAWPRHALGNPPGPKLDLVCERPSGPSRKGRVPTAF